MLTRIASNEVGHGVIYVDIPSNVEDFGEAFEKALNFAFEKHNYFLYSTTDEENIGQYQS